MKNLLTLLFSAVLFNASIAQQKPAFVPGNIIVQVPDGQVNNVIAANRLMNGAPTELKLNRLLSAPMAAYLLEFNEAIHHKKLLQQIWDHPSVSVVQFNHYIENRNTVPDDPQLDQQWWHVNDGSNGGVADADIDSDEAWDITTGGLTSLGDTIVVCVVDDGGDLDHPDLIANNWVNYNEIPNNNIDDDGNGYVDDYLGWNPTSDDDDVDGGNHGVEVAGMVGAVGNNGTGVSGVNWNVKIMNMTYGNINQEANVVEAYTYPLVMRRLYENTGGDKGAFVVATNSSWGINFGDPADSPLWCAFYDTLGEAGILSAGATANLDIDIDAEGDLPTACSSEYMLSITATNNADVRTFSGYGATTVDLGAPGEDVRTTAAGGGYSTTSGTSFATPATAGAIALLYSAPCASLASIAHADPQLAAEIVRDAIFDGVDPVSNLGGECVTGGRLNLKGALDQILSNCSNGGCLPPFTVSASNVLDVSADIAWGALANIDSFNISYGPVGGAATEVSDVTETEYALSNLTPCSEYWFTAQSICDGEISDWADTLFLTTDGCCEAPQGMELSDALATSITASWNAVLAADSYTLQWRELGNSNWNEIPNVTSTTQIVNALDSCIIYEFRVATICNGNQTDFGPIASLGTNGCGPCIDNNYCEALGNVEDEYISEVIVGDLTNLSGAGPGGYEDFTTGFLELQRGATYPISLTPGYVGQPFTEHFRIWIDLNQNGTFNSSELLFDDNQGTQTTISDSISIPLSAELGSTRMRVSMAFGFVHPQQPCEELAYGEVEDYCVEILMENEDTTSTPTRISETSGEFGMKVYPVPASNSITVELDEKSANNTVLDVLDITGSVIGSYAAVGFRTSIDLSQLSDGVYLIQGFNQNRELIGRKRFLKQ